MTSSEIDKQLYKHFHNYDFKLSNSFIYPCSGECDFFAISKTGYQVEVEIKISRSDFFVDFKKPKHKFYASAFQKKTHLVTDEGKPYWPEDKAIYGSYEYFLPHNAIPRGLQLYAREGELEQWEHNQMLQNWPSFTLRREKKFLYGNYTRIKIHHLDKVDIPHRLFYAVPKGLIKIEEVPPYAGLIETDGYVTTVTKNAPYIHKRQQNIDRVLLQKFYYECIDWRCGRKKLQKSH